MNGILVINRASGLCLYYEELVPNFGLGETPSELMGHRREEQARSSSSVPDRVLKLAATITALQLQASDAVRSSEEMSTNNPTSLRRFVSKDVHVLFETDDSCSLLGVLLSPVHFLFGEERASRAVKDFLNAIESARVFSAPFLRLNEARLIDEMLASKVVAPTVEHVLKSMMLRLSSTIHCDQLFVCHRLSWGNRHPLPLPDAAIPYASHGCIPVKRWFSKQTAVGNGARGNSRRLQYWVSGDGKPQEWKHIRHLVDEIATSPNRMGGACQIVFPDSEGLSRTCLWTQGDLLLACTIGSKCATDALELAGLSQVRMALNRDTEELNRLMGLMHATDTQ